MEKNPLLWLSPGPNRLLPIVQAHHNQQGNVQQTWRTTQLRLSCLVSRPLLWKRTKKTASVKLHINLCEWWIHSLTLHAKSGMEIASEIFHKSPARKARSEKGLRSMRKMTRMRAETKVSNGT